MNCNRYLTIGIVLLLLGGCVASGTTSRRAVPTNDAAAQMFSLGAQYYRNGNYELARDRLQRAIELDERNATAHSLLALTYIELGNPRLATESFGRSVRLAPNDKDVRNNYAIFLCGQGRFDEAREQFDKAIAIRDNDTRWIEMTNAGVCMAGKPDAVAAEAYFQGALDLRERYGEALIQMAFLQFRNGEFLRARGFMERYLAAHPASSEMLYLAVQIETMQQQDRAASDYQSQLLTQFPDSPEAKLLLQRNR